MPYKNVKLLPDTMDYHRLYQLLKNVPSDALKPIINGDLIDFCSTLEDVELVAISLVGTMMAYLLEEERPGSVTFSINLGKVRITIYHDGTGFDYEKLIGADNLLEALADACQKIDQET